MHISEGIVAPPILAIGGAVTAIGCTLGLKKIDGEEIMTTALLTATFFVATLIHIPLGPASIHLVLCGLLGISLGWAAFPAIFVALLLQALFFQYGGIAVLGVNTANMALPAVLCHYLFRPMLKPGLKSQQLMIVGFCSGFFAICCATVLMSCSLYFTDHNFLATAQLLFAGNFPLMLIEGFITAFALSFLAKVKPEFVQVTP